MLLTKPLTQLLTYSLSPPLTTLLLITPSGQLLASASSLPSSILRSRATLAMSIWEVYAENAGKVDSALPETQREGEDEDGKADAQAEAHDGKGNGKQHGMEKIQTITLQLTLGILTIRLLSCGLLVMGMSDPTALPSQPHPSHPTSSAPSVPPSSASALTPRGHSINPGSNSNQGSLRGKGKQIFGTLEGGEGVRSSAASDAGSTGTVSGRGREVQAVRRGTEEVSRWLERELVGYRVGEGI